MLDTGTWLAIGVALFGGLGASLALRSTSNKARLSAFLCFALAAMLGTGREVNLYLADRANEAVRKADQESIEALLERLGESRTGDVRAGLDAIDALRAAAVRGNARYAGFATVLADGPNPGGMNALDPEALEDFVAWPGETVTATHGCAGGPPGLELFSIDGDEHMRPVALGPPGRYAFVVPERTGSGWFIRVLPGDSPFPCYVFFTATSDDSFAKDREAAINDKFGPLRTFSLN